MEQLKLWSRRTVLVLTVAVVIRQDVVQPDFSVRDTTGDIKIGAFNVQAFGKGKSAKRDVMNIVAKVVQQFDIILLQEVRDANGEVSKKLLDLVNSDRGPVYKLRSSSQLGRGTYKERYVFYYRSDKIAVNDDYQFANEEGWFARPPFAVRFKVISSEIPEIAFAAAHISPNDAVNEISHLVDVYDAIASRWSSQNVILGGDFNAGCSYVRSSNWPDVTLWTDERFTWLIDSCVDTTAKSTHCPYDRFVVAGFELQCFISENSAGPYRYDKDLEVKDTETVLDVSDHYPIGMKLRSRRRCPTAVASAHRGFPTCKKRTKTERLLDDE